MGAPSGLPDGEACDAEPAGAASRSVADPPERPFAERLFARPFPWPLSWLFDCVIPRVLPCPFDWLLAVPPAGLFACLFP
ncbi:hypothetical protein [Streptomyces sp. MNU89]|uniref:hypothetical protein n=1 Tax=Streptomyces sp. MNU89 TaxID=2560025 RepID=UPI001E2BA0AC|nr:hypothetical protein [Streptomyces sp. MNU89]MCC9739801.1 hypothetical protein [Streptomyces sp. MNU89]